MNLLVFYGEIFSIFPEFKMKSSFIFISVIRFMAKSEQPLPSFQIILLSAVMCIIYWFFGRYPFFYSVFVNIIDSFWLDIFKHVYQFFTSFLFLFFVPLYFIKKYQKMPEHKFGLQSGDTHFNTILYIISFVAIIVVWFGSEDYNLQNEYPLSKNIASALWLVILYEFLYFFYYIGWEFHFRGFLTLGLSDKNKWFAIIYATLISTIMHYGKPISEIIGAAFIGILFGILILKGKSIGPFLFVHYLLGVANDIFCLIRLGLL